jgi:enoyl-CoA hydratase/carnithine racemase
MVRGIDRTLIDWQHDNDVEAVVITGDGDRAFCAGGDVKSVYLAGKSGEVGRDGTLTADFFREEYALNHRIAGYPKPYISYLDGVPTGGGVGISIMGSHRIASEHMLFAMPETGIGFFPDVGGSYFMSRLGPIGLLLALTGQPINYADALALGIATHFVPRESGRNIVERIAEKGIEPTLANPCGAIPAAESGPQDHPLEILQDLAERCFRVPSIELIFDSLRNAGSSPDLADVARQTQEKLATRSPTSLKLTCEQLSRGSRMSFAECLVMEYRISQACMKGHDFYEGIRAVLIDKDHLPRWSPESVDTVDTEFILSHFENLGDRQLQL